MLRKGEEGSVEVRIRNKDYGISTGVGPKGEDARNSCVCCSQGTIVTSTETAVNTRAIGKGEEGYDEVVGVGDGVDVDRVMVLRGMVGQVNDGLGTSRRGRGVEGREDSGVGPCETCGYAEDGEGGRQEGGERGGDRGGRDIEGGGVVGGEGAKESSGGEL